MDQDHIATEHEVGSRRSDRKLTSHPSNRGLSGVILGVLLIMALLFVAWWLWSSPETKDTPKPNPKAAKPVNEPLDQETEPDPRFVQKNVGWSGKNRVFEKGISGDTPEEVAADLLKKTGHSAQALAVIANGAGLWRNPNKVQPLLTADKKYLSEKGIELWYSLEQLLCNPQTAKKLIDANPSWYNSGVSSKGKYGRSGKPGIRGNRRAIEYSLPKGFKLVVLLRCGNVVFPSAVKLPVVPTDNPRPKLCPKNCDRKLAEQPVQENVAPPTRGVTRGVPDRTKVSQDVNANNPDPVEGGKTGQANNNTTTRPDGGVESSPKYPVDPDPPPPKNDVPDGGILDIVE